MTFCIFAGLPGVLVNEVTTLRRDRNMHIIIIIITVNRSEIMAQSETCLLCHTNLMVQTSNGGQGDRHLKLKTF